MDTRILAATNRNLEEAVADASCREDLYYRLNVVTVQLPPLRDRMDSIPLLVDHFLNKNNEQYKKSVKGFSEQTMQAFMRHSWPGNVRELENALMRAAIVARGTVIGSAHLALAQAVQRDDGDLSLAGAARRRPPNERHGFKGWPSSPPTTIHKTMLIFCR